MIHIYDSIGIFVKKKKYLELGCGSGILIKFLTLFASKKIIPYGVDINSKAIELAKHNNPNFENNFINEDYFQFLQSHISELNRFSTINIFMNFEKHSWDKLLTTLISIINKYKNINILICDYEDDFMPVRVKHIRDFLSAIKKISSVSIINHSMMYIGRNMALHKIAHEINKNVKIHSETKLNNTGVPKSTFGIIYEKHSEYFCIQTRDESLHKKLNRAKFYLSPKCKITKRKYQESKNQMLELITSWRAIKKNDKVAIIYRKSKNKNIAFAVIKYTS